LRKRVVLELQALGKPALGDGQHLREEPVLHLAVETVLRGPVGAFLGHGGAINAILVDFYPSPPAAPGADGHSQADPYPVALAAGASVLTADFGYRPAGVADSGVIGDLIWVESDGDGRFGAGDVGQAGVTVELSQNNEVIAATTSGAGGRYSFVRLPAGTYALQVSDDFGVLAGLAPPGPRAAARPDNKKK
jgi:hypothetical protein